MEIFRRFRKMGVFIMDMRVGPATSTAKPYRLGQEVPGPGQAYGYSRFQSLFILYTNVRLNYNISV